MEYIYATMLLHKAGKKVNDGNLEKVLTAAGVKVDKARIKSLTAAIAEVKIDEAIKSAALPVAAPAAPASTEAKEEKKEAKKEKKEEKKEEVQGLGALFG